MLHVLLFVYWLGADIGVFYSARVVRDSSLGIEARRTALRILGWIDQIPRYCLVLMLPVGYGLAASFGAAQLRVADFVVMWMIALIWLWMVWTIHAQQGSALGQRLRRIDLIWRWMLVAGLLWDAWRGLIGAGHIRAPWLAAKIVLLATLIFCGIMIRLRGVALGPALRDLFLHGSTPEREAAIVRSFSRTRPFVLAIWVLLVITAYVGIAKPDFGVSIQ